MTASLNSDAALVLHGVHAVRACPALRVRFALLPLLLGVALAFVVACEAGLSDGPAPPVPPEEAELPRPPDGALIINGVEYPLAVGSYCWGSTGVVCRDTLGYMAARPYARARSGDLVTLAGPVGALQFDPGTVRFGIAHGGWLYSFESSTELPLEHGEIRLPDGLDSGRYLIALHISYRHRFGTRSVNNSATYSAVVEVE